MSKIIGRMEAIAWKHDCCVIFLHHSSKSAAMGGQGDAQQASRGSSVLVDNIRWQAYMSGMSKEEAKAMKVDECERGFYVRFGISKQNYGRPFEERWFRRGEGGVLQPTLLSKVIGTKKAKGAFNE